MSTCMQEYGLFYSLQNLTWFNFIEINLVSVLIDCMRKKKYCFAKSNSKNKNIEESTSSNEKASVDQLDMCVDNSKYTY